MTFRISTTNAPTNQAGFTLRRSSGFTLLEVLIAVFILAVLAIAITGIAVLGTRSAVVNEQSIVAQGISSEELERLRVLSYDEVGFVSPASGQPDGLLEQAQQVNRNGQDYVVTYEVELKDDAVNGLLTETLTEANADYKVVTITTSYTTAGGATRDNVVSTIVADTVVVGGCASQASILAHWSLDDTETGTKGQHLDSSGNGHHSEALAPNRPSNDIPFGSGESQEMGIPGVGELEFQESASTAVNGLSNYSISLWVKSMGPDWRGSFIGSKRSASGKIPFFAFYPTDQRPESNANKSTLTFMSFATSDTSGSWGEQINVESASELSQGAWHHLGIVACGDTSTVEMYIDGNLQGSDTGTTTLDVTTPLQIGSNIWGPGSCCRLEGALFPGGAIGVGSGDFEGFIDDVRIYEGALTGSQMSQLAAGNEPF